MRTSTAQGSDHRMTKHPAVVVRKSTMDPYGVVFENSAKHRAQQVCITYWPGSGDLRMDRPAKQFRDNSRALYFHPVSGDRQTMEASVQVCVRAVAVRCVHAFCV